MSQDKHKRERMIKAMVEIDMRRIELVIHSAFIMGFLAHAKEQRTLENEANWEEIHHLIKILTVPDRP